MEAINTPEFIEKMRSHDERLKHIETATQVDYEIQHSIALPLIIKVAQSEADDALGKLATVDPSDVKKIIALQGKIYCATMLKEIIDGIMQRAVFASRAIQEDIDSGELNGEEIGER